MRHPAVLGAIGMLTGYCGTLLTPMAANFNIVPAVLLELPDPNGVIRAQWPTAVMLLAVNFILMWTAGVPVNDRDIPNVLLTGFEPFGGERINPSGEIVRALDGAILNRHRVVTAIAAGRVRIDAADVRGAPRNASARACARDGPGRWTQRACDRARRRSI